MPVKNLLIVLNNDTFFNKPLRMQHFLYLHERILLSWKIQQEIKIALFVAKIFGKF
jgi:hypothetical protein